MFPPGQLVLPIETPRPAGSGPALSDRLCALIVRRGRPLEVGHVASQLLRLRRCPEALQRRLVAEIVDSDARLAWHGRDLVGLAPPGWVTTDLREATFCVVDLETTGGAPGSSRVTEIGAVRVAGMRIVDRFSTLVDPGHPIPPFITAITGIDDLMVRGMPDIGAALDAFREFAGEDVLVAHNAPFDLRFLNYERRRLRGTYFTQPWLDTLSLSRRLLAGRVGRHDLSTLAEWADTVVRPCHRALPDAEATGELLVRLLAMLHDAGETTVSQAMAYAAPGGSRFAFKLALADDLPTGPGVYLMRGRGDQILYVGKARDIRRRARAYFGPGGRHGRLVGRALEQLERFDHERTDTELDALLREGALLRELRPPCNRRGLGTPVRYLGVDPLDGTPRLSARPPAAGAATGPVRAGRSAERALAALSLLHPPGDPDARRQLTALVADDRAEGLGWLAVRVADAARRGAWVADEETRAALAALVDLLRTCGRMRRLATARVVLCEPAHDGGAVLFGVVAGRVVRRVPVSDAAWRRPARGLIAAVRGATCSGGLLPPELVDDALILDARIRDAGPLAVTLTGEVPDAAALAAIGAAMAALPPARRPRAAPAAA